MKSFKSLNAPILPALIAAGSPWKETHSPTTNRNHSRQSATSRDPPRRPDSEKISRLRFTHRLLPLLLPLLNVAYTALAQQIITATNYSGFMQGNGYGWPLYIPASSLGQITVLQTNARVVLDWSKPGILQRASRLTGPWSDVAGACPPYAVDSGPVSGSRLGPAFFRLRGVAPVHSGVGTGCPQQGFDFTGLPPDHWANWPATTTQCGWIVPESATGFADVPADGLTQAFVRVVLRSFSVSNNWTWWKGSPLTDEDDATHQNDGWFHFRVRNPTPAGPLRDYRLRFELCFDNPYAFSSNPLQLNYWWLDGTWDWEDHNGRRIFTPMFRLKSATGVGPWQHIPETNAHPVTGYTNTQRYYRCLFEQPIPPTHWSEIEVAQNLPYTLEDREAFLTAIQAKYLPLYSDLCIRKKHLGYGGLYYPASPGFQTEFNELYAIEIFKKLPGSAETPNLATNRVVVVLAGMDYEPAGNFVAEGVTLEILDKWNDPTQDYRNHASYVVILIGNPDAYEWAMCHVVPYGNGYADSAIHRAHMFLESENSMADTTLDPEALALRNYIRALTAQGLDGRAGQIVTLLDFQNDLCPHPSRWQQRGSFFPPIWGILFYSDTGHSNTAVRFLANLRRESSHPNTGRYVRDPASSQGWLKVQRVAYGIPLWLLFEFDAAALYSHVTGPPGGWFGHFQNPIQLLGTAGNTFYVHGYLDQIGQATAGDPAHVFKLFGRDIADAARQELLP